MLIKGHVVPLRAQGLGSKTSKCALKGLDNSSFEMDLYMLGRSLTLFRLEGEGALCPPQVFSLLCQKHPLK